MASTWTIIEAVGAAAGGAGAVIFGAATWRVSSTLRNLEQARDKREREAHDVLLAQDARDAEAHAATMAKMRPALRFRHLLAEAGRSPDDPRMKWSFSVHNRGGERATSVTVVARRGDEEIPSSSGAQEVAGENGAGYYITLPDDWVTRDGGSARPAPGVVLVASCSETGAAAEWSGDEDGAGAA